MLRIGKGTQKNRKLISDKQLLDLSKKVVSRYVSNGAIPAKEQEDIQMGIVEKFLMKHDDIQRAYKGKAKVTTYCVAVLNKMCCEQIRNELKNWKLQPVEQVETEKTSARKVFAKLVITDEVRLLNKIICLFNEERYKVHLFLAYFYQLVIEEYDIACYDRNYLENKLPVIFGQINLKTKGEIFDNLAVAVFKAESKNVKADAVRMWLNKGLEKIIVRLNGPYRRAEYDRESAQILFEIYYLMHKRDIATAKKEDGNDQ